MYLAEQLDQVRLLYHVFYLSGIYSLFQRRSLVDTVCRDFGILSDSENILDVLLERRVLTGKVLTGIQCRVLTGKWTRSFALILCSSAFGEFLHFGLPTGRYFQSLHLAKQMDLVRSLCITLLVEQREIVFSLRNYSDLYGRAPGLGPCVLPCVQRILFYQNFVPLPL